MRYFITALLVLALVNCSTSSETIHTPEIDSLQLTTYMSNLASDQFLGRMPFTEGETITVNYIRDELATAGVEPGNGDTYFQEVKLVRISSERDPVLNIKTKDGELSLQFLDDFAGGTTRVEEATTIENSELVFVGYGIVAPEYDWNDYEGLDMSVKLQW